MPENPEKFKNKEFLGEGGQKKVYTSKEVPEKVLGELKFSEDPNKVKMRFYLGKIAHLLFPENVADVHLRTPKIVVKTKIPGQILAEDSERDFEALIPVYEKLKAAGILLDWVPQNFIRNTRGDIVYVDDPILFAHGDDFFEPEKIKRALEALPEPQKSQGLKYLERLLLASKKLRGHD